MYFIGKPCTFTSVTLCHQTVQLKNFAAEAKNRWLTKYAKKQAEMKKKREILRRGSILEKYGTQVPLIHCKNEKLNHYQNFTYAKFIPLPLASNGWYHRKSAGDYFTIYSGASNLESQKTTKNDEVPNLLRMEDFGFANEIEEKIQEINSFSDLNLDEGLIKAVEKMGIKEPSEIQQRGIPAILSGRNIVLTAHTGCGKTLAFLLPLLQHILNYKKMNIRPKEALDSPFVIIISPSRELSAQTYTVAKNLANYVDIVPKLIVGGHTNQSIREHDHSEVDILIGSMGAVSKFITKGAILLKYLHCVVLDEADTLLDENFSEKLMYMLKKKILIRPRNSVDDPGVQLIMVGATMPVTLPDKMHSVIPLDDLLQVTSENINKVLAGVKQKFIRVNNPMKPGLLLELVQKDMKKNESVIVFRISTLQQGTILVP